MNNFRKHYMVLKNPGLSCLTFIDSDEPVILAIGNFKAGIEILFAVKRRVEGSQT
jgi:hypothetical protein